ncbi:MAG TPA: hemin uptake protein HemP [Methylomirabilota bacterium]|nr:hemin uptake protein HemP [Methylomirabilota bacterium]
MTDNAESARGVREASEAGPAEVRIASSELFQGWRDVVILHRGQEYRLHITKADELILTK